MTFTIFVDATPLSQVLMTFDTPDHQAEFTLTPEQSDDLAALLADRAQKAREFDGTVVEAEEKTDGP
jgi:hypothetical protein